MFPSSLSFRRRFGPWIAPLLLAALLAGCGDAEVAPAPASPYGSSGEWLGAGPAPRPRERRNLILIVIDTLRADALARMPFLRELAEQGVLFEQACAPAPWTPPSIATLLCGLLPFEHGCHELDRPLLPDAIPTYAEVLSTSYGYQCTAFVDGPWFARQGSLLQGFEVGGMSLGLGQVRRGLDRWQARREPAQPFFLFVHTFDAHDPYGALPDRALPQDPLPESLSDAEVTRLFMTDARRREQLLARLGPELGSIVLRYTYEGYRNAPEPALAQALRQAYFDGVAWVDGLLREAVTWMKEQGLLENTLLVVTSDHGEAFGEHGFLGHGRDLHDELLRIPLIVVGPAPFSGGRKSSASVGLVDVLATFLEEEGLVPLEGAHGRSLAHALRPGGEAGWPITAQEQIDALTAPVEAPIILTSVRQTGFKWLWRRDLGGAQEAQWVFDLAKDPQEAHAEPVPEFVGADAAREQAVARAREAAQALVRDRGGGG